MTFQQPGAYAATAGAAQRAVPAQQGVPMAVPVPVPVRAAARRPAATVRDLREREGRSPRVLAFAAGDTVVVSGLPGSGKSTLIRRTASAAAHRIDSQDVRERWEARMPRAVPYALYRPLVRVAHYAGLRRALRSGEGVVVHDCGTQTWVRRWLARDARRRGVALHLVLLDVTADVARAGQQERGRGVSGYAFARHRRAVARLVRDAEAGRLPVGCASAVLLDRDAAGALTVIEFPGPAAGA
ncbi:ATP-binding protein [Streptomyces agglomeratus]|uniref:ATP-binding protein n=1 Tax=Streptomyces agglomeratus TaxID=285458 RepID=A0A1E5P5T0_9ACTN|nr:AAA family ATPase [Streptomyces agglomeratus]OEJ24913.1 ATP-binding protein [Streptomyces agglomeratus]OEJ53619.1 ATP-binding protein [Streptomyces agglomeratus]OEJ60937.1 ATP-binding protein [Streptomyces agglomeratus]